MPPTLRNSSMNFLLDKIAVKASAILIFQLSTVSIFSQVGPGGINTNLRGWYRAETGVSFAGGAVSGWADQSGLNFHGTQTNSNRRPAQTAGIINYNTALTFDGQDDYLNIPDLVAATTTGLSTFAVARQTGTTGDIYGCVLVGQTDDTGSSGGYGLTSRNAGNSNFGFFIRDFAINFVGYNTTMTEPSLMTGIWNGTTANNVQYFHDGTSRGTDPYTPGSVGDNGSSYIGSGVGSGTDYCFLGNIAEVIVYNTGMNAANVNRVESYLAIKYGITLGSNYVNSAGTTTIFTNTAPFNNDIIGIGRDDNTVLNQKQSRATDDSSRIFINTLQTTNAGNAGTFAANNQYVVLGHNNDRLSAQQTEKPTTIYSRLRREWKVTNTNFTGTFSFSVKLNSIAAPTNLNQAHIRLLVDLDGDFSNATVVNTTATYAGNVLTMTGISTTDIPINSTRYITIGSDNSNSPLPIELLSFETMLCDNQVCIKWKTATEKNNDRFEVTRSANGEDWQLIKTVKGAGDSYQPLSYETRDESPLPGTSYYRLRQVDFDGSESYSPITSVKNEITYERELKLVPNPSNEQTTVPGFTSSELRVYNVLGAEIKAEFISDALESRRTTIQTANLPEGIYFVVTNNKQVDPSRRVVRLVVKHK